MNHSERIALVSEMNLTDAEKKKRAGLANRKPYVAEKLSKISENENNGIISPIIRIEKSYLCNFQCTHCSAEYYMDRHLEKKMRFQLLILI